MKQTTGICSVWGNKQRAMKSLLGKQKKEVT